MQTGENPELQKRVSSQIKQKWSGADEERLLADLRRGPEIVYAAGEKLMVDWRKSRAAEDSLLAD